MYHPSNFNAHPSAACDHAAATFFHDFSDRRNGTSLDRMFVLGIHESGYLPLSTLDVIFMVRVSGTYIIPTSTSPWPSSQDSPACSTPSWPSQKTPEISFVSQRRSRSGHGPAQSIRGMPMSKPSRQTGSKASAHSMKKRRNPSINATLVSNCVLSFPGPN